MITACDTTENISLAQTIRNELSDQITSGILHPGASLDEQKLALHYGVSRTPIREALQYLEANGLAKKKGRRGLIVMPLTEEAIMDMFEASAELEATCVRLATYRMTPLERSFLMKLHESSLQMVVDKNINAYDEFNRQFHGCIYKTTHNTYLAEIAHAARSRLSAFRRSQLHENNRIAQSRHEHNLVMEAIAEGNGDKAAALMRAHMLNAATALSHYIENNAVSSD